MCTSGAKSAIHDCLVETVQIDLKDIAFAFHRSYKKLLREFVSDDCSGDYRKLLLLILGSL